MQIDQCRIGFKPVARTDMEQLAQWMERPHWREWWGDPETELAYIGDMIEGRDTTRPFIFHINGEAAGYIQYWFVADHQNAYWIDKEPWLSHLPRESVGVDLSIADPDRLSQGIGSKVLRQFADMLRNLGHKSILIDPDRGNRRAIRAYEKAGFHPFDVPLADASGVYLMKYELEKKAA